MQRIEETVALPASAAEVWAAVGDFAAVGAWHPMLARVEGERSGVDARRTAQGKDGSTQVERLLELDPARHRYRYAIETTPMPVREYVAEWQVVDSGGGMSTVRRTAEFETTGSGGDETAATVRGFLRAGLDAPREKAWPGGERRGA
jgi:hypothetical protein